MAGDFQASTLALEGPMPRVSEDRLLTRAALNGAATVK